MGVGNSEVWAVVSGRMLSSATGAGKAGGGAGFEERGTLISFTRE